MADDSRALAVVALGFSAFALVVVVAVAVRVGRLLRAYDGLVAGEQGASFTAAVGRQTAMAQELRTDVQVLREDLAAARGGLSDALRHVAVVRYDAFGDMGGMLSFSVALLDDAGDGVILTSINGRTEARCYAKGVQGRTSVQALSPEEQEALDQATSDPATSDPDSRTDGRRPGST